MTGIAQAVFPQRANGSLVRRGDVVVGSELVGQTFSDPKWFWGRPSATSPSTNGAASSGSNLGPTNPALADAVESRVKALRAADPANRDPIPVDLVTASGSGLDPEITPAAARFQVGRVARARGVPRDRASSTSSSGTSKGGRSRLLGEPRVNVLMSEPRAGGNQ